MFKNTHKYPFRLGCTSYVYPEELLPNVEKTAPLFDDIEIVLFESEGVTNFPSSQDITTLSRIGEKHNTTFTIHFPIDKKAASPDPKERSDYLKQMVRIVDLTSELKPYAFLLHLEGASRDVSPEDWLVNSRAFCMQAHHALGIHWKKMCIENLGYPYLWNSHILQEFGGHYAFDVGHALRYGENLDSVSAFLLPKTKVIHLHGWNGEKDHLSLKKSDQGILKRFIRKWLSGYTGVLTLEVFSESDTFESVEVLGSLWEK